ncbi:MAG: hypothetical protein DI584_03240 [Stenotrophomonas sp.]|nr:MAG: hypothetical protein DI584_03240 [Stenotrophomonas sp.]
MTSNAVPAPSSRPDLVVIGAGVVGLATAYAAAKRGCSVLLLDRDGRPGNLGATAGNGIRPQRAFPHTLVG